MISMFLIIWVCRHQNNQYHDNDHHIHNNETNTDNDYSDIGNDNPYVDDNDNNGDTCDDSKGGDIVAVMVMAIYLY